MAINTYDRLSDEARYCDERMRRANSRDEYEYYRNRLHELERRTMDSYNYYLNEQRRVMPAPMPSLAPEPTTPLTFLKSADKKLLLIGAPT